MNVNLGKRNVDLWAIMCVMAENWNHRWLYNAELLGRDHEKENLVFVVVCKKNLNLLLDRIKI